MADTIKIGSLDISSFKVGSSDCTIYLGSTLLYSGGTTPPTPPTPTLQWVSYSEGDTVPSSTIYGVKLGDIGLSHTISIEFGDTLTGVGFIWEGGDWAALDFETQEYIDISNYYDEATYTYIILFSDLGYSGMPISYPQEGTQFEFDVQLYEEHVPTLQWVAFSAGDTIPSTLNVYGISGDSEGLMDTFSDSTEPFYIEPYRRTFDIYLVGMYYDQTDNVNYIFSDMTFSSLGDYINFNTDKTVRSYSFKLYIYV